MFFLGTELPSPEIPTVDHPASYRYTLNSQQVNRLLRVFDGRIERGYLPDGAAGAYQMEGRSVGLRFHAEMPLDAGGQIAITL